MHVIHDGEAPMNSMGTYNGSAVAAQSVTDDDKTYAMLMHLSVLAHFVLPYISLAIPIVMWLTRKDRSGFIDDHGREAVNFQISVSIYSFVLPIIGVIIMFLTLGLGVILLIPLVFLPYVLAIVGMVMAIVRTNKGEYFRYPMTIRFL
ncbi:MAG: DUF4870 domain-containing protein [Phycisphaera sp.]|nr:MAG: DUF4870 domain-containing protein [Phycisphaera sp.]